LRQRLKPPKEKRWEVLQVEIDAVKVCGDRWERRGGEGTQTTLSGRKAA